LELNFQLEHHLGGELGGGSFTVAEEDGMSRSGWNRRSEEKQECILIDAE